MFSFFMALTFFLQGGDVTATTVACFSSGSETVYLGDVDFCCNKDIPEEDTVRAKCCSVEITAKEIEIVQDKIKQPAKVNLASTPQPFSNSFKWSFIEKAFNFCSFKSPPISPHGPEFLALLCTLRL